MKRIGNYEVRPFDVGSGVYDAHDVLERLGPALMKVASRYDDYLYAEIRTLAAIPTSAPFGVIDVVLDEPQGLAGYIIRLPGPVVQLTEALQRRGATAVARLILQSMVVLHACGIAYRNFAANTFAIAADSAVPFAFGRAVRMGEGTVRAVNPPYRDDEIGVAGRAAREFDPPEAMNGVYDGVLGDTYGLGCLFQAIGVEGKLMAMSKRMSSRKPEERPSLSEVLKELEG